MRQAYAFCFAQKEGCRISKIVFKQWLYAPNKKSTPKTVTNMLQYIATRDGVELNPLPLDQELSRGRFVDYIATRPGAAAGSGEHGLFGKLMGMKTQGDIARLEQARNYVERLAQGKTAVYNAVISLEEADALEKGLDTRGGWEELIRTNIHEIARGMGIPPRTLEYCCAVHLEQGHPHLHLMYWDTAQKVGVNFIQPEASNTIRKKLIRNVFQEEIGELMAQKDEAYKTVLEQADQGENSVLKNQRKLFGTLTLPEIYQMSRAYSPIEYQKILNRRQAARHLDALTQGLLDVHLRIKLGYPKGSLKYQYLPEPLKKELDTLAGNILTSTPDLAREYNRYLQKAKEQAELFGGKQNVSQYIEAAAAKMKKTVANRALGVIRMLKAAEYNAAKQYFQQQYKSRRAKSKTGHTHFWVRKMDGLPGAGRGGQINRNGMKSGAGFGPRFFTQLEAYGRRQTLHLLQEILGDLCTATYTPPTARQCEEALRDLSQKDKAELRAKNLDKAR